jgi:hypothetical protein
VLDAVGKEVSVCKIGNAGGNLWFAVGGAVAYKPTGFNIYKTIITASPKSGTLKSRVSVCDSAAVRDFMVALRNSRSHLPAAFRELRRNGLHLNYFGIENDIAKLFVREYTIRDTSLLTVPEMRLWNYDTRMKRDSSFVVSTLGEADSFATFHGRQWWVFDEALKAIRDFLDVQVRNHPDDVGKPYDIIGMEVGDVPRVIEQGACEY